MKIIMLVRRVLVIHIPHELRFFLTFFLCTMLVNKLFRPTLSTAKLCPTKPCGQSTAHAETLLRTV